MRTHFNFDAEIGATVETPFTLEEEAEADAREADFIARKQANAQEAALKELAKQTRSAFAALPVATQKKYKNEVRDAAFFLEEGNLAMVLDAIEDAENKLVLPSEQAVKDIIDSAKLVLS